MNVDRTPELLWAHVTNRGARNLPTFGDPADCRSLLALFGRESERAGVGVHAYSLMPNHFHLLVHGSSEGIAEMMQYSVGLYTRRFNRKYGYDGSLFRGRYHPEPIESEQHLLAAVRYIHQNPFASSGQHKMLHSFRWTSHPGYLGEVPRSRWLQTGEILKMLGGDLSSYRRFMESWVDRNEANRTPWVRSVDLTAIEVALGVNSPSERENLRQGGRGVRNALRLATVLLATESANDSTEVVAARYGFGSTSSVRSAASRARRRADEDPEFAALIRAARRRLSIGQAA